MTHNTANHFGAIHNFKR